jgi:hypothetical protein
MQKEAFKNFDTEEEKTFQNVKRAQLKPQAPIEQFKDKYHQIKGI